MKIMIVFFTMTALVFSGINTEATYTEVISFDALPSAPFSSYGYDLDNDGTNDIVFKTDSDSGFTRAEGAEPSSLERVKLPGLQGQIRAGANEHEVIVEFLGGATGRMSFDFVVGSDSDSPEAYVQVYGSGENDRCTATAQASRTPAESFLTIDIPFVAHKAVIDFCSGKGSVFIMDNFQITSGTTQNPIPAFATAWLLGSGLITFLAWQKIRIFPAAKGRGFSATGASGDQGAL